MIPFTIGWSDALAAAALLVGVIGLGLNWRHRLVQRRENERLLAEMERGRTECLGQIGTVRTSLDDAELNAHQSLELLRDGRLNLPARARALRMMRSGMSAETTAMELGMARSEVRLLEKVAAVLAPRG